MSPRRKKPPKPVVVYRDAKLEDVLTLLPLGEASFYETGYDKFSTFDKTSAVKSLELLIREKNGMLFVVEVDGELVGMAAAIVYPFYWNEHVRTCQHLFWYLLPKQRGKGHPKKLMRKMEDRAHFRDCIMMSMMSIDYNPLKYRSRGFVPKEHIYMKNLTY